VGQGILFKSGSGVKGGGSGIHLGNQPALISSQNAIKLEN